MRRGVRLGLDVGSVRVGVAVSDPDGILATPLVTLDPDPALLEEVLTEHAPIEVVVGLPRHLSGAEGQAAEAARDYARAVAARVAPVGVRLVDERLTSVDAHRALRESGVSGRRQRAVVDQAAAVLILQSALDEERRTGRPPGQPVAGTRRKPRTKDRHA